MKVEGSSIRLDFTHLGGGLVAKDGPLKWFQIAGADQQFVDAEATIVGNSVVVKSDKVAAPVAVRYAWDNYPFGCNLYNDAGLPAAPFRTDAWDALEKISQEFTGK
jgi:sialate O-acetylesterase